MIIFKVLHCLYCRRDAKWINVLSDDDLVELQPYLIQRWLMMNQEVAKFVTYLDKFVFTLDTKQYLSLAWSILPKYDKTPHVTYIKKLEEQEEKYKYVLDCVRKQFMLSDNDYNKVKNILIKNIEENKVDWFKYYGANKKMWKDNNLDFEKIKESNKKPVIVNKWF
jgi:hypothetical protein